MTDRLPLQPSRGRMLVTMLGGALFLMLAIALAMHRMRTESVYETVAAWVHIDGAGDSWATMKAAFEWLRGPRDGLLYQSVLFRDGIKFQYPPSSLLVLAIPQALGIATSENRLNFVSWLAVWVEAGAVALLFARTMRGAPGVTRSEIRAGAVIVAAMTITFYPVSRAFNLGQIQTWLNATFAVAALLYLDRRRGWAGCLIGAICLVKPQFGLFLVWALLRREWRFAAAMVAVVAIGNCVSLLWFGWRNTLDYLAALSFMGRHGEAFYANQSVNGLLQRLTGNADGLVWHERAFPPFDAAIYAATLVSSLLLVGFNLVWRRSGDAIGFLAAALTFTMASPIAWEHHFGILPPILAVLAALLAREPRPGRLVPALLAGAYVVAASFFPPGRTVSGIAGLLDSYLFFAALAVLALLYRRRDPLPA